MNRFGVRLLSSGFFIMLLSAALLVTAQTATEQTSTPIPSQYVPKGYSLVFGDEFEQVGLDPSNWKIRYKDGSDYHGVFNSDASVVQPNDSYLHLVTNDNNGKILIGQVRSVPEFKYGYFEARIRFQTLQGHHGAFWLQSEQYGKYRDDPAKSGAEIDIVEFFGNGRLDSQADAQSNVYWNAYITAAQPTPPARLSQDIFYRKQNGIELSGDFHLFSLLWTADEYVFAIDGQETWRTSGGMSNFPEYVVLSLVSSNTESEMFDTTQLPNEMLVDYVRVYKNADDAGNG